MLPFEHIVILDRKSNIPVYKQIAFSIINAIQTGILKASMKLPGSRDLSQKLECIERLSLLPMKNFIPKTGLLSFLENMCMYQIKYHN